MINYSLLYDISDVKRTLQVEKKFILDSIYHFSDFFSAHAKPDKGSIRKFTLDDIRVLAYISMYWENNPDIEAIKIGLNSGDQYEELYDGLIQELTPIFQEFNDNHLDNTTGIVIGGMIDYSDKFQLAKSYKKSGDELIALAIENDEKIELFYPTIYCYRHAIELFLKSHIGKEIIHHKLDLLYSDFEKSVLELFNVTIPQWFTNLILALNDFDSSGTTFRYGDQIHKDEHFVDLNHLKRLMDHAEDAFLKIHRQKAFG